jgi:nitrous oxidase accessory protein NosD
VSPGEIENPAPVPLSRYRFLEKLGQGGMGEVYLAHDLSLDRRVAIKLLPQDSVNDPGAVARFQREARALARLSHPGIVQAFDCDTADGRHFLVMEHVEGWSLSRALRDHGPLPPTHAADYVRQAALALQHAHSKGLIHRDLKPANLLVTPQGQVKLLDLGLARFLQDQAGDPGLTREGSGMGTPDYCAPEQARDAHSADARSDVYALGCTLYHLLTGQVPFPGSSLSEKHHAHAHLEPIPVEELCREVPVGLALVVRRMMARRPQDRFQTAGEAAEALAPFVAGCSAGAAELRNTATWDRGQLTLSEFPGRPRGRKRWAAVGAALTVAGLAGLLAWWLSPSAGEGPGAAGRAAQGKESPRPQPKADPGGGAPAKGEPPPPADPDVLTVAQDGTGKFRTIQEALAKVDRPGMTVRVLDAGIYAEALEVTQPSVQAGLTLEAPRRATLAPPPKTRTALTIVNVPEVTVRGFRLRVTGGGVVAWGHCPGLLLDGLEFESPRRATAQAISLEGLELPPQEPPAVVQNCSIRPGYMLGIRLSGLLNERNPKTSRRVIIRDNRIEKTAGGILLTGRLEDVQVVGNRIWGTELAGIQLQTLMPGTKSVLIANNTLLNCGLGLRLWEDEARVKDAENWPRDVRIHNNLILGSKQADMLFTDSGGHPLEERGPGDGDALRRLWQFGNNWREGLAPRPGTSSHRAWIPAEGTDVLRPTIALRARKPGAAGFLQPAAGSPLATEGAGKTDPSLPSYVGAVPPEGVEAWDWDRTWLAPPPGKLLTVSQQPEGGGTHRSLTEALAQAKPWATIRVLDDATYRERLVLDDPGRHEGVVLEAPKGAVIELGPQSPVAGEIRGVPHVRLRGFRFEAPRPLPVSSFVRVTGRSPGVVLEGLRCRTSGAVNAVHLERVRVGRRESPVQIRDSEIHAAGGIVIAGPAEGGKGLAACGGIAVLQNRLSGEFRGVTVQGAVARVLIAGNVLRGYGQAALQVEDLDPDAGPILFANNTALASEVAFRLWHNDPQARPRRGQVALCNNLLLEARRADFVAVTLSKLAEPIPVPESARAAVRLWDFQCNCRHLTGIDLGVRFPLAPGDQWLDAPRFASREPNDRRFLRPAAGEKWALQGAGRYDPTLPRYVGAVPPPGVEPWDWSVTWRARMRKGRPAPRAGADKQAPP